MHHVRVDLLDIGGEQYRVFRDSACNAAFPGVSTRNLILLREVYGLSVISDIVFPSKGVIIAVPVGVLVLGRHGVSVAVHPDHMAVLVPVQALQVGL